MPNEPTGTTILGLRMSHELRKRINAAAAHDGRCASSFARYHLGKAAERALATTTEASPRKKTR